MKESWGITRTADQELEACAAIQVVSEGELETSEQRTDTADHAMVTAGSLTAGADEGPMETTALADLRGRDLVEALIERDSRRIREQTPEATMALRAVRRKYESDAARIDGAYHFMKAKGLVKRQPH